jgi:hypothetical protein
MLRKKKTQPLSIAGQVVRGQCVRCVNGDDNAAAVALAGISEPSASVDAIPAAMATPILSSPVMQLDTQYTGNFNNYGERHGEGELVWSNQDRYTGTRFVCVMYLLRGGAHVREEL